MNHLYKILCLLISLKLLFISSWAQASDQFLQRLSVKDGLSQATIHDIFKDNEGFFWIATDSGLNLYDGNRFRVLPGSDGSLENSSIFRIREDEQGLIWILSNNGLLSYDKKMDSYQPVLTAAIDYKKDYIYDFILGESQVIWAITETNLIRYDQEKQVFSIVVDLTKALGKGNAVYALLEHDKHIYLATRNGMFVVNKSNYQWRKLPSINQGKVGKEVNLDKFYNLYISKNQTLYLGTYAGLYKADVNQIESFLADDAQVIDYGLIDKEISSWVFKPTEESLYVGSQLGLSKVDLLTDKVEHQIAYNDVFDDISNNVVSAIFIDEHDAFWLGSTVTGIYKWDPKLSLVSNYHYNKSDVNRLSDNNVWGIQKSKTLANKLWVATENGLNLVDINSGAIERFLINNQTKNLYTSSYIYQIEEDQEEHLWLSTAKGMRLFDVRSKSSTPFLFSQEINELLSTEHYSIYIDKHNFFWGITATELWRLDITTGKKDELKELAALASDEKILNILGFLPESDEMLLSSNSTLMSFNVKSRQVQTLYQLENVPESDWNPIDSWVIDDLNTLWLAYSSKGLVGLDAKTYQQKYFYHKKNAQIDHNIYGLVKDENGGVWFSSHNGIYHLNPETNHIRNFNVSDGLSAPEFNAGAYEKIHGNLFAYGSINGLTLFDPEQLKAKNYRDEITIHATNVDVLSRKIKLPFIIDESNTIELNYDDVGIRFEFSALTYQQNNLIFNFKLLGANNVDYPDTKDNFITFANLPSGEHILSVRARSPYTGEYTRETQLNINVSYAPWASPVAYFIYFLTAFIAFIVWIARKRAHTKQLVKAHEQVIFREQRLSLALHGSNSAVWDWQAENNLMFGSRAEQELGFKNLTDSYSFDQHIELIHDNDREAFVHQWQTFIDNADVNDNFSCSYRLRNTEGEWLWYKDLGKIVDIDEQGNPSRITGSYTNITQTRAASERAQYYGEAFKQTKDWVLIICDNFSRVMVNNSLREAFGWHEEEFSFDAKVFGLDAKRMAFYKKLFLSLNEDDHWRGEELITTKMGEEYHVLLNINVSRNETTNSLHYVCIFTDITAQKAAEKELRYLANYDHLTDLPNRSLLLERIKHGMDYSKRISQSIALFFIDLDRFKQVNDSLGHDVGDLLLQEITTRLKSVLRVDDTVARLGGDEFVVLLESYSSNSQLGKIAQKIIETIGEPLELNGNVISVGASIGIALYPDDANNSDDLLKNADVAMYHAKQIGRNSFQFFTPRMNIEASHRLLAETKVRQAYENDEFINYYQPIVDSSTGQTKGFELLLRWQSEDKLIMPGEFIAIAEEMGLIIPMTEKALHRALTDLQKWRKEQEDLFISVNLSAIHFSRDDLVNYLTEVLEQYNVPANLLKLEVTESALIKDPVKVIERMRALAKLGVTLALDDFGTGYSSLNYLKQLPLDFIKIDRSFISGIGRDSADEAIVEATIVLANNLCMHCIAEGVETQEQLSYLAERNCYAIQGYLYSKPIDAQAITQYLAENNPNQVN